MIWICGSAQRMAHIQAEESLDDYLALCGKIVYTPLRPVGPATHRCVRCHIIRRKWDREFKAAHYWLRNDGHLHIELDSEPIADAWAWLLERHGETLGEDVIKAGQIVDIDGGAHSFTGDKT